MFIGLLIVLVEFINILIDISFLFWKNMDFPKEYPMAVAVALAMNVQCFAAGMNVGGARKKMFNK